MASNRFEKSENLAGRKSDLKDMRNLEEIGKVSPCRCVIRQTCGRNRCAPALGDESGVGFGACRESNDALVALIESAE